MVTARIIIFDRRNAKMVVHVLCIQHVFRMCVDMIRTVVCILVFCRITYFTWSLTLCEMCQGIHIEQLHATARCGTPLCGSCPHTLYIHVECRAHVVPFGHFNLFVAFCEEIADRIHKGWGGGLFT